MKAMRYLVPASASARKKPPYSVNSMGALCICQA
jgi:hypothetical protein